MHDFVYKNGELCCEGVPVRTIAQRIGTPFYLYSSNTLVNHIRAFESAFAGGQHIICFALKSNSNSAVLRLLGKEGAGADIVSGGELFRALRAGMTAEENRLRRGRQTKGRDRVCSQSRDSDVQCGIRRGTAGDRPGCLRNARKSADCARVNPDIDPKTHAYISTGLKENKFGIPIEHALGVLSDCEKPRPCGSSRHSSAYRFPDYRDPAVCGRAREADRFCKGAPGGRRQYQVY